MWYEFYFFKNHIKTNFSRGVLGRWYFKTCSLKKIDADHIFNQILDLKIKSKSGNCPETMVTMSVVSCTRNQKM